MSWVLWDIIIPLLLAFALGLTIGWLLWRWRREQVAVDEVAAGAENAESEEGASAEGALVEGSAEKMESINAVLIAERDEAVERANTAETSLSEAQVEILKLKTELPAEDADKSEANGLMDNGLTDEAIDSSEKFQNLVTLLAREQEQRAEIDLELTEANDRYEILERELAKAKEAAVEVDETRLATLQEDLDLSQKVIEEKDQQYLDSVLEMEKLIEERDERIAVLEATIEDVANAPSTEVEETDGLEAPAETGEPDDTESVVTNGQETAKPVANESVTEATEDNSAQAVAADINAESDEPSEKSPATALMPESPKPTVSGGQPEALISQATAAEIAVALAEEFDIDTNEDPQSVAVQNQVSSSDGGRVGNDAMSPVSVEGDAANEDTALVADSDDIDERATTEVEDDRGDDKADAEDKAENAASPVEEVDDSQTEDIETGQIPENAASEEILTEDNAAQERVEDEVNVAAEIEDETNIATDDSGLITDTQSEETDSASLADSNDASLHESSDTAISGELTSVAEVNEESDRDVSEAEETESTDKEPIDESAGDESAVEEVAVDAVALDAGAVDKSAVDKGAVNEPEGSSVAGNVTEQNLRSDQPESGTLTSMEGQVEEASLTAEADRSVIEEEESVAPKKEREGSSASAKTAAKKVTPKKKAGKKKKKKSNANGYSPSAWEVPARAPTEKNRDQLTDIKGVGPVLEGLLHDSGIYYFKQVALLDKDGVSELQEQIPQFPGRIKRDKWVSQAKSLHRKKYGVAAKNS